MNTPHSKITAQGQVSIPVSVMRQHGLAPGETIVWGSQDGHLTIERVAQYSLEDVRQALRLPKQAAPHTDEEIRASIKARTKAKHAIR